MRAPVDGLLGSGWPPLAIVSVIAVVFIILGTVMDTVTIMMITAPILAGLITSLGYDAIWWGIMMVVLVEIGVITPPFGMNLFVIKALAPDVPLSTVYRGVAPFVAADLVKVVLLLSFPVITMWLPGRMGL
ncbi:MAG TPA: TRAP transporter large permease subunit [Burkholderiaceae bacterium]|nr:TRAP transporter large permease subunit [Burkholderiaceae bacterium]